MVDISDDGSNDDTDQISQSDDEEGLKIGKTRSRRNRFKFVIE